jgi:hypothetical protein
MAPDEMAQDSVDKTNAKDAKDAGSSRVSAPRNMARPILIGFVGALFCDTEKV